jgi:proteasome lid subunit RPN8/RPN11
MVSDEIKAKIKEHALKENPEECCGLLLLNKKNILEAFPCRNIAQDKENEFTICQLDYLKATFNGKIIGIYHSHCLQDNSFSELDKQVSHKLNLKNIVYILKKDSFEEYSPENYYNKYIDKDFMIGKSDCLSIVEKYYNEELGINISHYHRDENWDKDYVSYIRERLSEICGVDNFDDFFKKENFIKIEGIENAQKHDIIVFKYFENYPSHFGIYLGQNYILHQPRNKKSVIEKLTDAEKRRIYCFARSKELC